MIIQKLKGLGKTLSNIIPGNGEELQTPDSDRFDHYHYLRVIRKPTSIHEIRTGRKLLIPIRNGKQLICSPKIEKSEEDGEFSLTLEFENEDSNEQIQLSPDFPVTHKVGGEDISFTYTKEEKINEKKEHIYRHYVRIIETSELTESIYKLKVKDENLEIKICERYIVIDNNDKFPQTDKLKGPAEIKNDNGECYLWFNGQNYKCDVKKPVKDKDVWLIYTNIKVVK